MADHVNVSDFITRLRDNLSQRRASAQREASALLESAKTEEERLAATADKVERLQRERETLSHNLKVFDSYVAGLHADLTAYREGVVVGNLANRASKFDDFEAKKFWNTYDRIVVVKEILADAPRVRAGIVEELQTVDTELSAVCRELER